MKKLFIHLPLGEDGRGLLILTQVILLEALSP